MKHHSNEFGCKCLQYILAMITTIWLMVHIDGAANLSNEKGSHLKPSREVLRYQISRKQVLSFLNLVLRWQTSWNKF